MELTETIGHTDTQPGLRGHSWDPEFDLLKQFVVGRNLPRGGTLWLASFHTLQEAVDNMLARIDALPTEDVWRDMFTIIDQFDR